MRRLFYYWKKRRVFARISEIMGTYGIEGLKKTGLTEEEIRGVEDLDAIYRVWHTEWKSFKKEFEHIEKIVQDL